MTYDLAKQLKDAGFPQKGNNIRGYIEVANDPPYCISSYEHAIKTLSLSQWQGELLAYIPTLSELIEACGDRELEFWVRSDHARVRTNDIHDDDGTPTWFEGSTPKEAVAKLFIALNEK